MVMNAPKRLSDMRSGLEGLWHPEKMKGRLCSTGKLHKPHPQACLSPPAIRLIMTVVSNFLQLPLLWLKILAHEPEIS